MTPIYAMKLTNVRCGNCGKPWKADQAPSCRCYRRCPCGGWVRSGPGERCKHPQCTQPKPDGRTVRLQHPSIDEVAAIREMAAAVRRRDVFTVEAARRRLVKVGILVDLRN